MNLRAAVAVLGLATPADSDRRPFHASDERWMTGLEKPIPSYRLSSSRLCASAYSR